MLNVVELQPGEAMFLDAETPHAYLKGTAVEIMASSDNVLRAGLTPKHMDVNELVANTRFVPVPAFELLTTPVVEGAVSRFPVPVDDFRFEVISLDSATTARHEQAVTGAEIVLCIKGRVVVEAADAEKVTLGAGESAFVTADTGRYEVQGDGQLVRISA